MQMNTADLLFSERFPRTSRYNPDWVLAHVSGGANSLWLAEWLAEQVELKPGMRVLDLGCGRAASSIFLRREFGVEVWSADLWFSATENFQRIRDAGVDDGVFPLQVDARTLPFANDFFDAIVSIDSYFYFGTDDCYLPYLARFVKPGGTIAFAGAGLMKEFDNGLPAVLKDWWTQDLWMLHSADWWRRHWGRTGILDVDVADSMPDGWKRWLQWHRLIAPDNKPEIDALEADEGESLGYVRIIGRRNGSVALNEPITRVPTEYSRHPLMR